MQVIVDAPQSKHGLRIVHLSGDFDIYSAPDVRNAVDEIFALEHYHLLLDLKTVRYIDSAGLGILVSIVKRVREHGGSVSCVCTNPTVKRILDFTGLLEVLAVYDDERSAIKAMP